MIGSHEERRTLQTLEQFYSEHWRTHKRWAATVLALYGGLVSVGVIAIVLHRSVLAQSSPPAVEASLQTPAR